MGKGEKKRKPSQIEIAAGTSKISSAAYRAQQADDARKSAAKQRQAAKSFVPAPYQTRLGYENAEKAEREDMQRRLKDRLYEGDPKYRKGMRRYSK